MRLNTTDFRRKCQHPLLLTAGSIPVALILILSTVPEMLMRMWLFPAAYLLLGEITSKRQLLTDPFLVRGIRAYRPADPAPALHPPATASTGETQVRVIGHTPRMKHMVIPHAHRKVSQ